MEQFDPKTFVPISNHVLVRRLKGDEMIGGLHLPEKSKVPSEKCEVVRVGPGYTNKAGHFVPMTVEPGQMVLVQQDGGHPFDVEGTEYVVIREAYILAVLEEAAAA